MWFWWFMFISDLLIPLVMIVGGMMMWKRTPKKINGIYGYRTSRSMKNLDTWTFAHRYIGRLWCILGWVTVPASVISMLPFAKQIVTYMKSPSAWVVWGILFALFIALRNIIDEMVIVCFVGLLSNVVGMFIYKLGEKIADENKGDGSK